MNVLYVTNNSICIDPLFFHGEDICRGLPSQFHVLRAMGERGDKVDFVIAHEYQQPEIDIKCDWLMRSEIKLIDKGKRDYLSKVMFYAGGIIKKATEEMLAKKRYDFVYLHNAIAAPASGAAIRAGIPCGLDRLLPGGEADCHQQSSHPQGPAGRPGDLTAYRRSLCPDPDMKGNNQNWLINLL